MNFEWESEKERIARYMKISPKKKLEWLEQMRKFMLKFSSKQRRKIFSTLRSIRES